jgi:ParB-like chromosome segregation protein Spo0J
MQKMQAAQLVEDFRLYPRSQVDGSHVQRLSEALLAGETLPPIIVDESGRIIDGFHRRRAVMRAYGDEAEIEVEVRHYANERERYLDALRLNARHGKGITGAELTGAILKSEQFKLEPKVVASALGITTDRISIILQTKVAHIKQAVTAHGAKVPPKRSVHHLAGKTLTRSQAEAMDMLPGQPQSLLIRQIIKLIETGSLDLENEKVSSELIRLRELLNSLTLEKVA